MGFAAYLEHFDRIHFFSSRHESLEQFTSDRSLLRRTRIVLPATPHDGRVAELLYAVGDQVAEGAELLRLDKA